MRMRTKRWARPELSVCPFFIQNPEELRGQWASQFPKQQPVYLEPVSYTHLTYARSC